MITNEKMNLQKNVQGQISNLKKQRVELDKEIKEKETLLNEYTDKELDDFVERMMNK